MTTWPLTDDAERTMHVPVKILLSVNQKRANSLSYISPHMSPEVPRMGNAVTRFIGRSALILMGWQIVGQLPDEPKGVIIGVPHTSLWDFFLAMAFMLSVGIRFNWLMKKEGFIFPFGSLLRYMNGIPVDRSKSNDITSQMVDWFDKNEKAWLTIAPEGTRKNVRRMKTGYLRIATAVKAPVIIVGLHKPSREIRIKAPFPLTGDIETDNNAIKAFCDENLEGVRTPKT